MKTLPSPTHRMRRWVERPPGEAGMDGRDSSSEHKMKDSTGGAPSFNHLFKHHLLNEPRVGWVGGKMMLRSTMDP